MRQLIIAGIALLGIGIYLLVEGGTFTKKHDVLEVGDVKVTANEKKSIPTWVGGLAVVAGVGLIAASARKRA